MTVQELKQALELCVSPEALVVWGPQSARITVVTEEIQRGMEPLLQHIVRIGNEVTTS